MNKFITCLATFLLITLSGARADCPDSANCNLASGSNDSRYYPVSPCPAYPYMTKGAPVNRKPLNVECGANVKIYPLDEEMRSEYEKRGLPVGATYAPRSNGAYPDGRYGSNAPKGEYNLAETLNRCIKKDIDSKDQNKRIECLDAFDRALNDPAFADKHKELIETLVGFLKTNVPQNGAIDRPDLNMGTEILARNHRLDRDGCFNFDEPNMGKVKDYLNSRSSVVCNGNKPLLDDESSAANIDSTDASYVDPNVAKIAGLTDDEKNANPNNVSVLDGEYVVKGPDGKKYKIDDKGEYVSADGKKLVDPEGKVMNVNNSKYRLEENGTVVGPDGKKYKVDSEGKYVASKQIAPDGKPFDENSEYVMSKDGKTVVGPDGEIYKVDDEGKYVTADGNPVIGDNGEMLGPNGAVDSKAEGTDEENKNLKDAFSEDPRYKDIVEENKRLREEKSIEDKLIDKELTSDKYVELKQISALSCDSSSCKNKLNGKKTLSEVLSKVKTVLEDRNANIASRLGAICEAKCVSLSDKTLEPEAVTTLAKYVRRRVPWNLDPNPAPEFETKSVRPDVQAALYVIGGRDRTFDIGEEINLTAVDLRGADLSEANLENVDLSFSNLATTNLKNAKGLTKWDKINLIAIDETTLIPETVSAGYKVRRRPNILPPEVGSFKVVSDDWVFWKTQLVKNIKK